LQTEEVAQLRGQDDERDPGGEPNRHRIRYVLNDRPQARDAHDDQQHAGHEGRDGEPVVPEALDNAVDDDDERAGGAADLHAAAGERGDHEARDDRGEQPLLGFDSRSNCKRQRQR
jgi:hypothetical protein